MFRDYFIVTILLAICLSASSQQMNYDSTDSVEIETGKKILVYERQASFPGGIPAFYDYLRKKLRYPKEARKNNISGTVIATFIVEKDGSLSNFEVVEGIGYGCEEEMWRVLIKGPKWTPGTQSVNGINWKPVRQLMKQTLDFKFQ